MVTTSSRELFSLKDRTVVLTGASGFLGRTFSRALLEGGARLVALGRSERLLALGEEWRGEFGPSRVRIERVDFRDSQVFEPLLRRIAVEEEVGALVNNAFDLSAATGFNTPDGGLESATAEQWFNNFAGLYWAVLTTQIIGASMKRRGAGSIVNVSTMYAQVSPNPALYVGTSFMNPPAYSAAKAGLLAFTRYTASFWGAAGIRCNAILPGPFSNTEDTGANAVDSSDPFLQRLQARTSLGRIGHPSELVGSLVFLCTDASTYVTGHALVVDGGWTIT